MKCQRTSRIFWRFRYTVPTGATTHASEKCCRKGCENFQEQLYCCPIHCGPSIPLLLMGPPLAQIHHDTQHVAAILIKPWAISLWIVIWHPPTNIIANETILTQYSINQGLKVFRKKGGAAVQKELQQIHDRLRNPKTSVMNSGEGV